MTYAIKSIKAREILDSRGNPTIEVDVLTEYGLARAAVPSGASTGIHEALELRDGDKKRYMGKGVLKAVDNINKKIAPAITSMDCAEQRKIDDMMINMDGTNNKQKLGANAILAVSMAVCKAAAMCKGVPLYQHIADFAENEKFLLPVPSFNVINGGKHAGNKLDIQEYMIMPIGAGSFKEALRMGTETYHHLKSIIKEKYGIDAVNVGDEGGFAPPLETIEEPIELLEKAIKKAGYEGRISISLDAAASEFYSDGKYNIEGKKLASEEIIARYVEVSQKHSLISIEDPFEQEDFASYAKLTKMIGDNCQIVGDDLLVTNVERIKKAVKEKACNALLLKMNQIGSVSEAIDAAKLARSAGWGIMVSHRSGETEDSFIADLVVGIASGQIKSGAPCRSERLAKYNQLLRIEEQLGEKAVYAGTGFRNPI